MANPLYESLHGGNVPSQQDAMSALQANPAAMIRRAGYQIPDELANDPRSAVTYLIQTGQVNNPMLQKIRPLLSQMTGY